jgi:anti-sigma regulatory factor (Ser/Thr protein kinase)
MRAEAGEFAARAGAEEEQVDRVRLAVSEAVTNVIEHAYPSDGPGRVHMAAAIEEGELIVLVSDDGLGMTSRPFGPAPGLGLRGPSPGLGLGLALMADACDGLTISARSSGGVDVLMRFELEAAAERVIAHAGGSSPRRTVAPSVTATT